MTAEEVVFAWPIASNFGWGIRGLGYALNWPGTAVSASPELTAGLPPDDPRWPLLRQRFEQSRNFQGNLRGPDVRLSEVLVLIPLGNDLTAQVALRGTPTIACPVFEDVALAEKNIARLREYDAVVVASRWNQEVLAGLGVESVLCHEGVDPAIFCPGVRRRRESSSFRVFSGGKVEWRKGQDLVVEAFKLFAEKHDDAVLVAAWGSPFGALAADLEGKCAWGAPPGWHIGMPNFHAWVQRAGLRPEQFEFVEPRPNWQMAEVYHGVDVAVFPNRREGGTNFVAMECMACGVPTIIRPAFGQMDIEDWATYIVLGDTPEALATVMDVVYDEGDNHPERPRQIDYWTWERHCRQMAEIVANA